MPNHREDTRNAERETRNGEDGNSALRAPRSAFRAGGPDVEELIPTRDSLLSRLKDWRDDDSWRDFFNTYWKLVYGVALKSGLTEQEAEEVVQETVITVARRIPEFKYDPTICSFKTWLLNLTRWRIIDQLRKRQPTVSAERGARSGEYPDFALGASHSALGGLPNPPGVDLDAMWEREWQQSLVSTAIARVKRRVNPEHYQIFHLCVFKEWPVKKVARELEVNVAQVYLAKHRVGALLKKEVKALEKKLNEQ